MPANPDTHYTANLVTTSSNSGTSNAAVTSNGSVYLNLVENSTVRNSHNIVGDGTVTVKSDANGKITITGSGPDEDTKNTAGSTDTSSKIYLIGATTQAANPQTYSDNQVYATNGQLDANKVRIAENVTLEYNTTTKSLDFIFA